MPSGDRKGAKIVNAEFVSSKVLIVRWLSEKRNAKGNAETRWLRYLICVDY